MPAGGVLSIAVRNVERQPELPMIEIDFEDTGMGISAEVKKNIFVPFFTTKDKGSGLGLPIVLRIVEEHGGTVRLFDRDEGGTRFVISLPIDRTASSADTDEGAASALGAKGRVGIA
jgi:signal transduction histidine kinase